jgi:hypothetical protein
MRWRGSSRLEPTAGQLWARMDRRRTWAIRRLSVPWSLLSSVLAAASVTHDQRRLPK